MPPDTMEENSITSGDGPAVTAAETVTRGRSSPLASFKHEAITTSAIMMKGRSRVGFTLEAVIDRPSSVIPTVMSYVVYHNASIRVLQ